MNRKKIATLLRKPIWIPLGLLLLLALVLLGVRDNGPVFSDLEVREELSYSVQVPKGWQRETDADLVYYFDGSEVDNAKNVIMVGALNDTFENYDTFTDEQKDQLIDILQAGFNDNFTSGNADESIFDFSVVSAEVTSHPQADRASKLILRSADDADEQYVGEGRLMITESGDVVFIVIGALEETYTAEQPVITSIIDTLVVR